MKKILVSTRTLSALALILMEALILVEIVGRKLFNWSTMMVDEYSAYFFCAIFLGLGYTLIAGRHIRVSVLISRLSPANLRKVNIFCFFTGTSIMAYATYTLGLLCWKNFDAGAIAMTPIATPLFIPQTVMFIGALVFTIALFIQGIAIVKRESVGTEDLKMGM